jgi:ubiquitin-conjugating enzyme E2 variant
MLAEMSWLAWSFALCCEIAAITLIAHNTLRLADVSAFSSWWVPWLLLAALPAADIGSGLVHWTADTWGSESMPVLGPRFLRPFRVHHQNPEDILRRDFIDLNGDVAMLAVPLLLLASALPVEEALACAVVFFLVALCLCSLPTNQFHQWAHMSEPPAFVRWLQQRRLILSREHHRRHHIAPFASHYCITFGWCNPLLAAIGFFPSLERWISRATGAMPRRDER